jgi:hypothetical protein
MELKEIAAVSGKSGLFRVLKPTRTGVILESIDEAKAKLVANANNRVSLLNEISIYTTGKESSVPLEEVLKAIHAKHGDTLKVNGKSDTRELVSFMESVLPDYDKEKVYQSDIKKLVTWYATLAQYFPELLSPAKETKKEAVAKEEKPSEEAAEKKAEKPKKKPAAK